MVRNLGHDYRRESFTHVDIGEIPIAVAPAGSSIKDVADKLPPRDRDLLHRRYELGQTYQEIAADLGMTVSHVGVALHRAEKKLRKMLESTL
jgi:DNA-directed RNA polymerase specialized sigma24 family protein